MLLYLLRKLEIWIGNVIGLLCELDAHVTSPYENVTAKLLKRTSSGHAVL